MDKKIAYNGTGIYYENDIDARVKMLGVYSTKNKAEQAILKYMRLPGFKDYTRTCFYITKFKIGELHWTEGFCDDLV